MARDSLYPVSVKAGKPILGMLPTGWQKLSLEKCLNIEARKAYIQDNQEYDLVTVKRSRGGVIRREHLKGKDISVKSQFYIKEFKQNKCKTYKSSIQRNRTLINPS